MAASGAPSRHPNTLAHLKILKLHHICFGKVDEISGVLRLIRSSPSLEKILLKMSNDNVLMVFSMFGMYILNHLAEKLRFLLSRHVRVKL